MRKQNFIEQKVGKTKKNRRFLSKTAVFCLELISRFELETSSLPMLKLT